MKRIAPLLLAACLWSGCDTRPASSSMPAASRVPDVKVTDLRSVDIDNGMKITGLLKNVTTLRYTKVLVRFAILDASGVKLGETTDVIPSLAAGETWKFEAVTSKKGTYRLENIVCSGGNFVYECEESAEAKLERARAQAAAQKKQAEAATTFAREQQARARATQDQQTLKWHRELADVKNDPYGQLRMGERYKNGDGVEKDLNKARDYFFKAASQGNQEALAELQKLSPTVSK